MLCAVSLVLLLLPFFSLKVRRREEIHVSAQHTKTTVVCFLHTATWDNHGLP